MRKPWRTQDTNEIATETAKQAHDETSNLAGGRLQAQRPFISHEFTGGTFHIHYGLSP